MNIDEYLTKGNLTTFATWIGIILYPLFVKYGIDIDQATLVTGIYTLIVIIIAIISSANPNDLKILGNKKNQVANEETVLNPEYECENDEC